uniref:Uncharacterized protein n=1 Tax=Brassica campestris TaxID=3711 RepID=M4F2M2_BRACM
MLLRRSFKNSDIVHVPRTENTKADRLARGFSRLSSYTWMQSCHLGLQSLHEFVNRGDSRFEGHEILRFTREQLLHLKEAIQVSEASDLSGEEQSWGRSESKKTMEAAVVVSEGDDCGNRKGLIFRC